MISVGCRRRSLCQSQRHVTAQHSESRFNPRNLGRVVGIENATRLLLIEPHATREFRVADTGLAHRQIYGGFERH